MGIAESVPVECGADTRPPGLCDMDKEEVITMGNEHSVTIKGKRRAEKREGPKWDGLVKSRKFQFGVIPAEAGIQCFQYVLDAGSSPA